MSSSLSVVIPWRRPAIVRTEAAQWRVSNFNWVMARYERLFPDAEIIVSDPGGDFQRSKFINYGVSKASRENILIGDADTIPYPGAVSAGIDMLNDGRGWVIPYGDSDYYSSDRSSGENILRRDPTDNVTPEEITWEHKLHSWSGQVLIPRGIFTALLGFDERFQGWGFEDNAFAAKCDTFLDGHGRVDDAWTIHIWHPAPESSTWQQPNIEANRRLYEKYDSVRGDQAAMKRVMKGDQ